MTGEVPDRTDGRTLFYLDNKQFIELSGCGPHKAYKICNNISNL